MIAHPLPAVSGLDAAENVKPRFKPGGESAGDLERFVKGVVAGKDPIHRIAIALDGVVAVQFDHVFSGGSNRFGTVNRIS